MAKGAGREAVHGIGTDRSVWHRGFRGPEGRLPHSSESPPGRVAVPRPQVQDVHGLGAVWGWKANLANLTVSRSSRTFRGVTGPWPGRGPRRPSRQGQDDDFQTPFPGRNIHVCPILMRRRMKLAVWLASRAPFAGELPIFPARGGRFFVSGLRLFRFSRLLRMNDLEDGASGRD